MDMEQREALLDVPDHPAPRPGDVASPEATILAVYETISGPSEEDAPRDWDRLRSLFLPEARLVIGRWRTPEGEARDELRAWDVEGFIEAARGFYAGSPFYERELARTVDRFGNVAHVFSAYESLLAEDGDPVSRGINSVQAVRHGGRWWIAHLVWDVETEGNPIPEAYEASEVG